MATDFALRRSGHSQQDPNFNLAYLASAQGKASVAAFEGEVKGVLDAVNKGSRDLYLDLQFDPQTARFDSNDMIGGLFFGFLDSQNPPALTNFSYFPADRALPPGEQPVQIGAADAPQQIESHASQPQLKYSRLKNTIFNTYLMGEEQRIALDNEFKLISTAF